jgi:hypothetical protein
MIQAFYVGKKPLDKNIAFDQYLSVDHNPDYHYTGNILQNPLNKKIIHFFNLSSDHFWEDPKKCSAKTSTDEGQTFSSTFDIYDPSGGFGVAESGGGYDSNGRLHMFFIVRDNIDFTVGTNELRYAYSDDDGATISTPTSLTLPSDSLYGGWPTGRMIENNGVLLKNFYRQNTGGANSANYLLRSTDGGANWTTITIRESGTAYYNEADIIALSNTHLLTMFRDEANNGWQQYRSTDNGQTWASDGNIDFDETLGQKKPPSLRSFKIKNQLIIAFYSRNTGTQKNFVVYGKASDLRSSGLSGWNISTKLELDVRPAGGGGYNNEIHFDDSLRAMIYDYRDRTTYTETHYATIQTTHYDTLVTQLGGL